MHIALTTEPCPGKPEPMDFYAMTEAWYELFEPNQPLDALSPRDLLIPETPVPAPGGGPAIEMAHLDGSPFTLTHTTYPAPPTLEAEIPIWSDLPSMPNLPKFGDYPPPKWVPL